MAPQLVAEALFAEVAQRAPWLAPVLGLVLGAVMGSFINCARHRLPKGLSLWQPPSHCPGCKRTLGVPDLIPILSWLALRGRCRTCGYTIGSASLWHEVSAAVVGGFAGWVIGLHVYTFPAVLGVLIFYAGLVLISHSRWRKTPRKRRS